MDQYFIEISKEDILKCVDFSDKAKPKFLTLAEVKSDGTKVAYSTIIKEKIKEKFSVSWNVGNGKSIGSFRVSIYLICDHFSRFVAQCHRHDFKEAAVKFKLARVTQTPNCTCRKSLKFTFELLLK